MYNGKKGLRCRVCTGCGLCPGVTPEGGGAGNIHVLAEEGLSEGDWPETVSGRRLAAADLGTTTIAMLLYGADGRVAERYVAVNPQTAYGADVISRIRAAEDREKAEAMQRQALEVLERGIRRFQKRLAPGESLQLALAANTTMTYLLTGRDTSELGCAPFRASGLSAVNTEIGGVPCFIFPGMSAFVGGDITAGLYACGMGEREEITLFVDLGTNGELALGNRDRRIACATAAGPAFEGGANRGIWGADMVSILAALRREGLLDETGLLAEPWFDTGVRAGNVPVTREAVRSLQLAKAAVAAGIGILLERYGITAGEVERVILAGGFGYYLKPEDAADIGLLPEKLAEKAEAGGNTALAGGRRAAGGLLGPEERREELFRELKALTEGTECLNLAEEPDFGERYLERMALKRL